MLNTAWGIFYSKYIVRGLAFVTEITTAEYFHSPRLLDWKTSLISPDQANLVNTDFIIAPTVINIFVAREIVNVAVRFRDGSKVIHLGNTRVKKKNVNLSNASL